MVKRQQQATFSVFSLRANKHSERLAIEECCALRLPAGVLSERRAAFAACESSKVKKPRFQPQCTSVNLKYESSLPTQKTPNTPSRCVVFSTGFCEMMFS